MSDNPLEITEIHDQETGESRMYIPLDKLPEDVIEDLRAQFLKLNSIDADAEELGPVPPGVKGAEDQAAALVEEALSNPITEESGGGAASPSDALG